MTKDRWPDDWSWNRLLKLPALFVVGWSLIYIRSFIGLTVFSSYMPEIINTFLLLAGMTFLLMHCLCNIHRLRMKYIWIVFLGFMVLSYFRSGETAGFVFSLLVIASASLDDKLGSVLLWARITTSFILILIITYYIIYLIEPNALNYVVRIENGVAVKRLSFFFNHPNTIAAILMMDVSAHLLCLRDKIKFSHVLLSEIIAIFIYFTTISRTSFFLAAAVPLLYYLQKQFRIFESIIGALCACLTPALLSILTLWLAGPGFSQRTANLFTGRVALWHACFENQGITLFGQPFIQTQSTEGIYGTLDSFYAMSLFVLGVVFLLFFIWLFLERFRCWTCEYAWEAPALLITLFFGFTEMHILDPCICFSALLLGSSLVRRKSSIWVYGSVEDECDLQ